MRSSGYATEDRTQPSVARRVVVASVLSCSLAVGLYFRLDGFGSSLWLDEFGTLWTVERDLNTVVSRCLGFHGQTPLYYVFPWVSLQLLGESEVALRLPSLVFGAVATIAVFLGASAVAGRRAGSVSGLLFWLSPLAVNATVQARPYALVLAAVAVTLLGFGRSVLLGDRLGRALWLAGATGVVWAHYTQYPLVVGLAGAYVLMPSLRERYTPRLFCRDAVLHVVLVAPAVPQLLALFQRRAALSWMGAPDHLAFAPLVLPLLLPLALDISAPAPSRESRIRGLRLAWVASAAGQLLVLHLAALVGVNLLHPRYALGVMVPMVLLAATAMTRLRGPEVTACLFVFAGASAITFGAAKASTGSFSGLGHEDWYGATRALASGPCASDTLVLYRSGFVEQDVQPRGALVGVNLAPLRSPGVKPPDCLVRSLTYRWDSPARHQYFDREIVSLLAESERFALFGLMNGPEDRPYSQRFVGWVEDRWPGEWSVNRRAFGAVQLIEFTRRRPGSSAGPRRTDTPTGPAGVER